MKTKSLVSKFDTHLKDLDIHYHTTEHVYICNGFVYIDYRTTQIGALFYFIPFEIWKNMSYSKYTACIKEIWIAFDLKYQNNAREIGETYCAAYEKLAELDDEFDHHEALKYAERKAFEHLSR